MKYCVAANMAGSPTTPVPLSGDFCEQMRKAHEMGYDAIEIHFMRLLGEAQDLMSRR